MINLNFERKIKTKKLNEVYRVRRVYTRDNIFTIIKKTKKDRVCSWVFEFQMFKWLEMYDKGNDNKSFLLKGKTLRSKNRIILGIAGIK